MIFYPHLLSPSDGTNDTKYTYIYYFCCPRMTQMTRNIPNILSFVAHKLHKLAQIFVFHGDFVSHKFHKFHEYFFRLPQKFFFLTEPTELTEVTLRVVSPTNCTNYFLICEYLCNLWGEKSLSSVLSVREKTREKDRVV